MSRCGECRLGYNEKGAFFCEENLGYEECIDRLQDALFELCVDEQKGEWITKSIETYELPEGQIVVEYDASGVGLITRECMEMLVDAIKPNNCKYLTNPSGDVWECGCCLEIFCEHQIYDRNPDGTLNIVECGYEPKTEPMKTADYCDICKRDMCEDCVADATNPYCVPSHYEIRHEPKTEPHIDDLIKQADSLIEFEKELLKTEPLDKDTNIRNKEPQTELVNDSQVLAKDLVDDEFNPYDEECMRCKHLKLKCEFIPTYCKFESRDEPQKKCHRDEEYACHLYPNEGACNNCKLWFEDEPQTERSE